MLSTIRRLSGSVARRTLEMVFSPLGYQVHLAPRSADVVPFQRSDIQS